MSRQGRWWLGTTLVAVFSSTPARAHLNSTGLGPVYDGAMHVLTSPEDLVAVLALALFAGLRGPPQGRAVLLVLPGAWMLGGLAGSSAAATSGSLFVSAIVISVLGILVAADVDLPRSVTTAVAAIVGLDRGYLNGTGLGSTVDAVVTIAGLVAVVFVLVAFAAALVVRLRAAWCRIAVRVAGSWIAASGMLLLGWAVRSR